MEFYLLRINICITEIVLSPTLIARVPATIFIEGITFQDSVSMYQQMQHFPKSQSMYLSSALCKKSLCSMLSMQHHTAVDDVKKNSWTGPRMWNNLSRSVRLALTITAFQKQLKMYLFHHLYLDIDTPFPIYTKLLYFAILSLLLFIDLNCSLIFYIFYLLVALNI